MAAGKTCFVIVSLGVALQAASAQQYSVQQLTGISAPNEAGSVTQDGAVVGALEPVGGLEQAFVWRNGIVTTFSGYPNQFTTAGKQNTTGLLVGNCGRPGGLPQHAAIWQNGVFADLGSLAGPDYYSGGFGVNENGWIVGATVTPIPSGQRATHPFAYHDGLMHDLGVPPGVPNNEMASGAAYSINGLNHVVGSFFSSDSGNSAFFWSESGGIVGLSGGTSAVGVNNNDWVVGSRQQGSMFTGCLWRDGAVTYLGDNTRAHAVNDAGTIVGIDWADFRALVWADLVPHRLDTLLLEPGWVLDNALSINNSGQILAHATQIPPGAVGPFVLLNPVPEPGTLLSTSFLLLGAAFRRKNM